MTPAELMEEQSVDGQEEQLPRWELAECTCPDPCCERDHEQD
jgi:hypothetical protein